MKEYFDGKHHCKSKQFCQCDYDHVRRYVRPNKYAPSWTTAVPVVGLAAPSAVRLEDGSVYNGRDRLHANPEAESIGAETSSRSIQENPELVEETAPAVLDEALYIQGKRK